MESALAHCKRAINFYETNIDKQNKGFADAEVLVGVTLLEMGNHEQAESHLQRGLELRRRYYGLTHARTMRALYQMARYKFACGDFEHATALFKESLPMLLADSGPQTPPYWISHWVQKQADGEEILAKCVLEMEKRGA